MLDELLIRVRYPAAGRHMVLRTDDDWERDLEAESSSEDGTLFEFRVQTHRPYFYFKPCLLEDGGARWAQGANYLAITRAPEQRVVYPYFFVESRGALSEPLDVVDGSGDAWRVRVYHPPGYSENGFRAYPVAYMHDAHNLFFPEESFANEHWRVDETLERLDEMNAVDKAIVVGIYPRDRMHDYTRPGYEAYGRFVAEELKPFVDGRLRTLSAPEDTAVMGSSLGGVVSLYMAWQWPDRFGKAACLSSTFTWRDDLMTRIAREPRRPLQIYLDSGWPGDNYEVTRAMYDLLLRRGYRSGQDVLYLTFPHAEHSERAWADRLHIPLQLFFLKQPVFDTDEVFSLEGDEQPDEARLEPLMSLPEGTSLQEG